jgi:hypothetical protein
MPTFSVTQAYSSLRLVAISGFQRVLLRVLIFTFTVQQVLYNQSLRSCQIGVRLSYNRLLCWLHHARTAYNSAFQVH